MDPGNCLAPSSFYNAVQNQKVRQSPTPRWKSIEGDMYLLLEVKADPIDAKVVPVDFTYDLPRFSRDIPLMPQVGRRNLI